MIVISVLPFPAHLESLSTLLVLLSIVLWCTVCKLLQVCFLHLQKHQVSAKHSE